MNCKPKPVITCGTTISDTCVIYTGPWPSCFPNPNDETCFRQSEWNEAASDLLCALKAAVENIESSIDLDASGCSGLTPVNTTVKAEFQNVYNAICALRADLSLPLNGAVDTKCLQDPCGDPIATLGDLLQAMIDAICCIANAVPDASGCVI